MRSLASTNNATWRSELAPRELECLLWIARGKKVPEIAVIMGISPHTVRSYTKTIHAKMNCVTAAQAVAKAMARDMLSLEERDGTKCK